MHKYGSRIGDCIVVMSRKDKRDMKKAFKERKDGCKGIKEGIATMSRIARNDLYGNVWNSPSRYAHFRYIANKLQ